MSFSCSNVYTEQTAKKPRCVPFNHLDDWKRYNDQKPLNVRYDSGNAYSAILLPLHVVYTYSFVRTEQIVLSRINGSSSSSSIKALGWKWRQCEKMQLIWSDCGFPCTGSGARFWIGGSGGKLQVCPFHSLLCLHFPPIPLLPLTFSLADPLSHQSSFGRVESAVSSPSGPGQSYRDICIERFWLQRKYANPPQTIYSDLKAKMSQNPLDQCRWPNQPNDRRLTVPLSCKQSFNSLTSGIPHLYDFLFVAKAPFLYMQ